jgi:hypothetical protein
MPCFSLTAFIDVPGVYGESFWICSGMNIDMVKCENVGLKSDKFKKTSMIQAMN